MIYKEKVIGLVRHGETDWNTMRRMQGRENIPLNSAGIEQSYRLGQEIIKEGTTWDLIVSSPLIRADETARILQNALGHLEIITMEYFVEREFGAASGLTRSDVSKLYPDARIPGREDNDALLHRVQRGLDFLVNDLPQKNILLVTHGEVMRTIYRIIGIKHKIDKKPGNASIDIVHIDNHILLAE